MSALGYKIHFTDRFFNNIILLMIACYVALYCRKITRHALFGGKESTALTQILMSMPFNLQRSSDFLVTSLANSLILVTFMAELCLPTLQPHFGAGHHPFLGAVAGERAALTPRAAKNESMGRYAAI